MGLTDCFRTGTAAVVLLIASAGVAAADTIILSWIPGSITSFAHPGTPSTTGSGTLPTELRFDPSLGTLDAVDVRYFGSAFVSKTLNVVPGTYTVVGTLDLQLTHAATGLDIMQSAPLGSSQFTVTQSGAFAFSEGNSRVLDLSATQNLGAFITGGILELTATGSIDIFGPGGLIYSGAGDALTGDSRIGDSITYTYTPVPEPGTAVLAGLGLALLSAARRNGRTTRLDRAARH